jgi:uncharacterized protein with FMN-binding domain
MLLAVSVPIGPRSRSGSSEPATYVGGMSTFLHLHQKGRALSLATVVLTALVMAAVLFMPDSATAAEAPVATPTESAPAEASEGTEYVPVETGAKPNLTVKARVAGNRVKGVAIFAKGDTGAIEAEVKCVGSGDTAELQVHSRVSAAGVAMLTGYLPTGCNHASIVSAIEPAPGFVAATADPFHLSWV